MYETICLTHTDLRVCVGVCDTQFLRMFFLFLLLKFPMQENVFPKKKPEHQATEKPRSHNRGFSDSD